MRTDLTSLNQHYADFYARDPKSAWRELGAREKARSVMLLVDPPVGAVVDIGCGEGSVIMALDASMPPDNGSTGRRSGSISSTASGFRRTTIRST